MAYATVDELAAALRVTVTPANTVTLQACLDAAAIEIDTAIDLVDPASGPPPAKLPLLNRVNVLRGVEWWKSNDAAWNAVQNDPSEMRLPRKTFIRHTTALLPAKEQFGIA